MGRIFDQDAALYADIIQASPDRLATIAEFLDHTQALLKLDRKGLINHFEQTANWLGDFTKRSQLATDQLL